MKQEQKERKIIETVYIANDGTEFRDKDECQKYEQSARCALEARYMSLVVKGTTEYDLFPVGSEDNIVDIVRVKDDADKEVLASMYAFFRCTERNSEGVTNFYKELQIGTALISRGYDGDWFGYLGSPDSLISRFQKACSAE